jgi:hypothetical protein
MKKYVIISASVLLTCYLVAGYGQNIIIRNVKTNSIIPLTELRSEKRVDIRPFSTQPDTARMRPTYKTIQQIYSTYPISYDALQFKKNMYRWKRVEQGTLKND